MTECPSLYLADHQGCVSALPAQPCPAPQPLEPSSELWMRHAVGVGGATDADGVDHAC